jgi:hypothetical protein
MSLEALRDHWQRSTFRRSGDHDVPDNASASQAAFEETVHQEMSGAGEEEAQGVGERRQSRLG